MKNAIINAVIQNIVIKVNPFFGPFLSIYFPTGYVNATAPIIPIPNTINTGPESPQILIQFEQLDWHMQLLYLRYLHKLTNQSRKTNIDR